MKLWQKVLLFILFLIVLASFSQRGKTSMFYYGNPNEKSRFYSAVSLIENGTFHFEPITRMGYGVGMPGTMDKATAPSGKHYSDKAPLSVLLSIPVYAVYKVGSLILGSKPDVFSVVIWMRIWLALLPFLLSLLFLYKLLRPRLDEGKTWLMLLIFSLATMNFSFSFFFFGHTITLCLILAGLYFIFEKRRLFLGGLFTGLAAINEYPAAAIVGILGLFLFFSEKEKKNILPFIYGLLPALLTLGIYNWAVWGSPFAFSYQFVQNKGVGEPFWYLTWEKVWGVLFCSSRGFFYFSSIFLFSGYGIWSLFKEKKNELWLYLGVCLFFIGFMMGFQNWEGGWSPGIRHLIMTLPFWMFLLVPAVRDLGKRGKCFTVLFFASLISSVVLNVIPKIGFAFYPDIIPQISYWSGILYIKDYFFFPLVWNNWWPAVRLFLYLASFFTFFTLVWKWFIRIKLRLIYLVSLLLALLFLSGMFFLPISIPSEGDAIFYYLSGNFYNSYDIYYEYFSGKRVRIKTEFPENQQAADDCIHNKFNFLHTDSGYLKELEDDFKMKNKKGSPNYREWMSAMNYWREKVSRLGLAGEKVNLLSNTNFTARYNRLIKLKKAAFYKTNGIHNKRRLAEFLFHANHMMDRKTIGSWVPWYKMYMGLKKDWY